MTQGFKHPDVEDVTPYNHNAGKTGQVEEMFDSIAPAYDFMNTAMTFGLHRYWRNKALDMVCQSRPAEILDVATGTGDVAFALHRRLPEAHITGLDLSDGMLAVARRKAAASPDTSVPQLLTFVQGDSLNMTFPDNSFDAVTVAYGVRNFEHLADGYREMFRVLRPGGMICVIELSTPQGKITAPLYRIYSRHIIPAIGKLVSGDSRAYSYLPESIAAAPQRDDMTALMSGAGFTSCRWRSLTFGAVTIYTAQKPE